jgi:transcriptional regulator with XRE-family HTH domain
MFIVLKKGVIIMSTINTLIGERLRTFRKKQGLSQDKLAEKAGLHNTYIGQVERGEKNITMESLQKIVNALEISFEELFRNVNTAQTPNSIPADCYNMILSRPTKEQLLIKEVITKIFDFNDLNS